jgi:hypothetical protein
VVGAALVLTAIIVSRPQTGDGGSGGETGMVAVKGINEAIKVVPADRARHLCRPSSRLFTA